MSGGMQVTWRGRIGPATLSKPEAEGSSGISAQEEYELGAGRKVPRPAEQEKQEALRGMGLQAQAKDPSMRDKVIRGGGVTKKRQVNPKYKTLSTRSIPQWGDTNVSLVGDASNPMLKSAAAKAGIAGGIMGKAVPWLKGLFETPPARVMPPAPPKVPVHPSFGPFMAKLKAAPPAARPQKMSSTPLTEGKMRDILHQTETARSVDPIALAESKGMKVGPWAKIVNNPWGSMFMQMAAMSAIEPMMYGLGIRSPILGGVLPLLAMQGLPGLLQRSAGIPRMQKTFMRQAERGRLLPPRSPVVQPGMAPVQPPGLGKTGSVAIPEITTVFG